MMILEGLVTSLDSRGALNVAPMGPIVDESLTWLRLRPYKTSRTYQNLKQHPFGVFHVVDDVLLLARAAIGRLEPFPESFPAESVEGRVLAAACRWYEFEVTRCDDSSDRAEIEARVVRRGTLRDFFGFHRARHAVVEAAILATRVHLLPRDEIVSEFARLRISIEKTAGPREREAFALLEQYVEDAGTPANTLAGGTAAPTRPPSASVTVATGSRLHCGLFAPGATEGRRCGGVGVMIDRPGFVVEAALAEVDSVIGPDPWRLRAIDLLQRYRRNSPPDRQTPGVALRIGETAPQHSGFGSGTQFGLAVAKAASLLAAEEDVPVVELARRVDRGHRSAVGLHGFAHGGLLIEGGKYSGDAISPLVARAPFPEAWRFVLIRPREGLGLSGDAERQGFERLGPMPAEATDRLCRLALLELLPAVHEVRFDECARALDEFGKVVGSYFAPVQGGFYADPRMRTLAGLLRERGYGGVLQTSWGPTLFVLCRDEPSASMLVSELASIEIVTEHCEVTTAAPLNEGARITRSAR